MEVEDRVQHRGSPSWVGTIIDVQGDQVRVDWGWHGVYWMDKYVLRLIVQSDG